VALPGSVPVELAEAARDTLGGAIQVAEQLPGSLGPALIDAAREAFIQGLHVAAAISAVATLGLAILVMTLLRGVRTGSEPEEPAVIEPGART
jgi:DHA2 family multidrug resistance protein-like MFS transporter